MTVSDIIDALGGVTAAAKLLAAPVGTVSAWKTRGAIPADRWLAVCRQAQSVGRADITAEKLAEIHAAAPAEVAQ